MRTIDQIKNLLILLDHQIADDLEGQDLEFKEWDQKSRKDAIDTVIGMAICMANSEGGTVVFGIKDKVLGREEAISGVPLEVDVNDLKKAVYDSTDPKITPVFEELFPDSSDKRLLVMQIYPGMPPYTDTKGRGSIRVGKECKPLTGSLRRKIGAETGETDFTATTVLDNLDSWISPSAMESIRIYAQKERTPDDLLRLSDHDLLQGLDLLKGQQPTIAALLIAGRTAALKTHLPDYSWTYLKMDSDTEYSNRIDGNDPIPVAVKRIEDQITTDNPITTLRYGLYHFEYRAYPEVALREVLLNAFCHCDFRQNAPIMVKHFRDRLEISNPGGFIGGITASNILHHPPVPRNPRLVNALVKLRLVNRSNLGISRVYKALLIEGKEPPRIVETGESISVTFVSQDFSPEFRTYVDSCNGAGRPLDIDELIVIHHLLYHTEADSTTLAQLCQREKGHIRGLLERMANFGRIELDGSSKGIYWTLPSKLYWQLMPYGEKKAGMSRDGAKVLVYNALTSRMLRDQEGLSNEKLRRMTGYSRQQVTRLLKELATEHPEILCEGHGAGARYIIRPHDH